MSNDERRKQWTDLADLKDEAEERLYRRLDFGVRMARTLYAMVAVIAVAAIWLALIHAQVQFNTRSIEKLWQATFNNPLP
jgi:hypothetical protein